MANLSDELSNGRRPYTKPSVTEVALVIRDTLLNVSGTTPGCSTQVGIDDPLDGIGGL